MNDAAWKAFRDTLPPDHLALVDAVMARFQAELARDRRKHLDDVQRTERRSDHNAARINDLDIRLDHYEQQRAADVKAELERFAREQLSVEERDTLISVLYNLSARVETLEKEKQAGDDTAGA